MFIPKVKVVGIVLASLLIASGVWLSSGSPLKAQAEEGKDSKLKALLTEKLSILQTIASQSAKAYQGQQLSFAEVYEANQAVRNAELDLCDTGKERVAVLEKMLAEAKEHEEIVAQEVKSGTLPTSDALKAKVRRLDVEIALERAKGNCAVCFLSVAASAQDNEKAPRTQVWTVSFAGDTAIVRAHVQTDTKLIHSMIETLRRNGVERFALRSNEDGMGETNPSFTVTLVNDEAEISTSHNVPYLYIVSAISMLAENGARQIRFVSAQSSGRPAGLPETKGDS